MLDGPPFTGTPDTALHFVHHQQYAVAITDASQFLHEDCRCDYVSAFALHRLDEDCGHFLGGKRGLEELVFDEAGAAQRESFGILRPTFASTVYVGITNVSYARNQWAKAPLLLRLGSRQRKRSHGASMERAV